MTPKLTNENTEGENSAKESNNNFFVGVLFVGITLFAGAVLSNKDKFESESIFTTGILFLIVFLLYILLFLVVRYSEPKWLYPIYSSFLVLFVLFFMFYMFSVITNVNAPFIKMTNSFFNGSENPKPEDELTSTNKPDLETANFYYYGQLKGDILDGEGSIVYKKDILIDSRDILKREAKAGDSISGKWVQGHLYFANWYDSNGHLKEKIVLGLP